MTTQAIQRLRQEALVALARRRLSLAITLSHAQLLLSRHTSIAATLVALSDSPPVLRSAQGTSTAKPSSATVLNASLLRRYQALTLDLVVYFIAVVAILGLAPELLDLSPASVRLLLVTALTFLVLYEPLLVSRRGGTIGHYRHGLRVVDAASKRRLGFLRALGRSTLKAVLGLFSFLFILATKRYESLHDLIVGSVVVVANPKHATPLDYSTGPSTDPFLVLPSRGRRITVIIIYMIPSLLLMAFVSRTLGSVACLNRSSCASGNRLPFDVQAVLGLLCITVMVPLGWQGRLPGCRSRRRSPVAA